MSDETYDWQDITEMDKRKNIAQDFYNRILEPEDRCAYCVDIDCFYDLIAYHADDKCSYDISIDEKKIQERILHHYGQVVTEYDLTKVPFWKLLDRLYKPKTNLLKG